MSESAWLVCDAHRVSLGLGKPVRNPDSSVHYFHDGTPNSQNPQLTRALWKFLAEHSDHNFRIVTSYSPEFTKVSEYREIGSDAMEDIDFPEYLRDWPG